MRRANLGAGLLAGAGLLVTAGQVQAQAVVDVVAGPTFTNVATDGFDTSTRTGFFVAVGTALSINERLAVRPYLGYVQKGAKFTSDDGADIYSYIEIPVFLATAFPVGETASLGVAVGPQLSFNIKCNETVPGEPDYDCKEYEDYVGSTDFGLVGSVGLQFPVGSSSLGVGAGFDLGFKDIFEGVDGGYKNRGFYVYVGYGMMLGGM